MTAFLTAIVAVVAQLVTSFGTVAADVITNEVVIYVAGMSLGLLLISKVVSMVQVGKKKKSRR